MGQYVAGEVVKRMIRKGQKIYGARVLQLGVTFKENCTDIRNSHAVDVARGLEEFGCKVDILDPWANAGDVKHEYGLEIMNELPKTSAKYDAVVLTVSHREFLELDIPSLLADQSVVFDIKGVLPRDLVDGRL